MKVNGSSVVETRITEQTKLETCLAHVRAIKAAYLAGEFGIFTQDTGLPAKTVALHGKVQDMAGPFVSMKLERLVGHP